MPSHLKSGDARPEGVTETDVIGNALADKFAGESASKVQVSTDVAADCKYYYHITKQIQHRIAAVILALPARSKYKTIRTPLEMTQSLNDKIAQSQHSPVLTGNRYTCNNCHNSFLRTDPSFQHWLTTACVPLPSSSKHVPVNNDMIHVGNQTIHHTHHLAIHRGLVYCKKCGNRKGEGIVKKLAKACHPPTVYGRATLQAISDDRLPPKLDCWPESQT